MTLEDGPNSLSKQQFDWVDNAKALLIFLVVLGHCTDIPGRPLIYAFHVPAFLFVTGFLLPTGFGRLSMGTVFDRWTTVQLRAYLLFSVVSIAIWWVGNSLRVGHAIDMMPAIWGTLYGVGGDDGGLVHENAPLWYFPFLTVSMAGAWLCLRLPVAMGWVIVVVWALVGMSYQGPRLPWCLDIGGVGAFAMVAGYHVRQNWPSIAPWLAARGWALLAAGAFGLLLVAVSQLNGPTNLNRDRFGHSGMLYLLAMALGIAMTVSISSVGQPGRLVRALSRETLTIFAIHIYLIHWTNSLLPRGENVLVRLVLGLGSSAMVLLVSLGIALLLKPVIDPLIARRPQRR